MYLKDLAASNILLTLRILRAVGLFSARGES